MNMNHSKKQRGVVVVAVAIALPVLLLIMGMALDFGHVFVNKTRLQNALDATALSAAITINGDVTHNIANANIAGRAMFDRFKTASGNNELAGLNAGSLVFDYSRTLQPFSPGTSPPAFVRVTSTNMLNVRPVLIRILAQFSGDMPIPAIATAGAVGQNCSLVPFVMCAKMTPLDTNCDDDTTTRDVLGNVTAGADGFKDCYGYNIGQEISLVQACNGNNSCPGDALETGNFNLLNVGAPGANVIKNALNGTRNICGDLGEQLDTQPGYAWGPVRDGLNVRYNADSNTTVYPTAIFPADPSAHSQYKTSGTGNGKREIAAPIGDCRGLQTGNSLIPRVGVGCVFLTKKIPQGGSVKKVVVEFVDSCQQNGEFDPNNAVLNGPYKVVLFKSPGSGDS